MNYSKYPDLYARYKTRWAVHRELWEIERQRLKAVGGGSPILDNAEYDYREAQERLEAAEKWRKTCPVILRPLAELVRRHRATAVQVAKLRLDRETAMVAEW